MEKTIKKRIEFGSIAVGVLLAGVLVFVIWQYLQPSIPEGILIASGRIEGRITTVTAKTPGRVVEIKAQEGKEVFIHDTLAVLDDDALRARVRSVQESFDVLSHQLRAANTQLEVSQKQVPLKIAQAEAMQQEAKARLAKVRASQKQTEKDTERLEELLKDNLVSQQRVESARLKLETGKNAVLEAKAGLARAKNQHALAKLGAQQIIAQTAQRDALRCQTTQAEAAIAEQQSYINDLTIKSPMIGTVLTRNIERGEQVNPGTPLFTLVDMNQLYLKIYIPEPDVGKVQLDQEARIYVDAYPDKFFHARVSKVAQEAEFTPKNVETREERVKLVFAIELAIGENPEGVLKAGMPADAVLRWQADAEWITP